MAFFAPLLLAGIGLLAVPFLIHQIRRPERDPIPFSSLIFIPNVTKEVIERRRIQHILLMLLRMLLFLLLAFAFSRPYWKALAAFEAEEGPRRHLVLIDTSYSMGADGLLDDAKREAKAILDDLEDGDRVGVVVFARSFRELAALHSPDDPEVGTVERARLAIDRVALTEEDTAYLPALQYAQSRMIFPSDSEQEERTRLILHLISDFQRSGMPAKHTGWKLAPAITLHLVPVEVEKVRNQAIMDVGLKKSQAGAIRVLGKIKNWSEEDAEDLKVTLFVNGEERAENVLTVKSGNASQTAFQLDDPGAGQLEGSIRIEGDAIAADNVRYFTWSAPRKKRVLLVADEWPDLRWPTEWFFARALDPELDLPWIADRSTQSGMEEAIANPAKKPSVVIAAGLKEFRQESAQVLADYLREGGQVLLVLNDSMDAGRLNAELFEPLGFRSTGPRYTSSRESRFDMMSWVDLEHEIFVPFNGARFNDFSSLRFYNHHVLEMDDVDGASRVLAKYEDDSPAMVESKFGSGRLITWSFDVRLDQTNFPKTPRFVPLVFETLAYLSDMEEGASAWYVGQRLTQNVLVMDESGVSVIQRPSETETVEVNGVEAETSGALALKRAGFFRTRRTGDSEWRQVDAVNVRSEEGDPTPIALPEFELKMASAPVLVDDGDLPNVVMPASHDDAYVVEEYGYYLILLVFAFILVESWYMSALRR